MPLKIDWTPRLPTQTAADMKGGMTMDNSQKTQTLIEILDNNEVRATVNAASDGSWSTSLSSLSLGKHVLTARTAAITSLSRSFTVVSAVPEFVLDPSSVTLGGTLYVPHNRLDILPSSWPVGTTATRTPISGVQPYIYSTSNAGIATVDGNGQVAARQNGTVSITVTDALGRYGSYQVIVRAVLTCVGFSTSRYPQAVTALNAAGCRMPSLDQLRAIYGLYGSRWPQGNDFCWSNTSSGLNHNWVKNLVTGQEGSAVNTTLPGSLCLSTGLR
jgi:hypothetical protein